MNKYWYVVKDQAGICYIGFCYGREDATGTELVQLLHEYVKEKGYKELALLVHINRWLGIVNQIYPASCTEETRNTLEEVLKVAM